MDPIRANRRYLLQVSALFLVLSLPSLAFRWWHPHPLEGFREDKYRWMARVLKDAPEVRIGFVGSSQTHAGIDAVRISQALYGRSDAVLNFGVNWGGRGRDYLVAQQLLEIGSLDALVVEVGHTESEAVHAYFHRLASLPETLRDPLNRASTVADPGGWRDRYRFFVLESLGNTVAGYARFAYGASVRLRLGESGLEGLTETSGSVRLPQVMDPAPRPRQITTYAPDPRSRSGQYFTRIVRLCRDRDVQLVFVDIPQFGDPRIDPGYRRYLESLGATVVAYPQEEELFAARLWADSGHLNRHGAALFSDWLVEQMRSSLPGGSAPEEVPPEEVLPPEEVPPEPPSL